jgi:hypothetical protein
MQAVPCAAFGLPDNSDASRQRRLVQFSGRHGVLESDTIRRAAILRVPLSKKSCHVGQITGILSSSQDYQSPRRETGGGLFKLDYWNRDFRIGRQPPCATPHPPTHAARGAASRCRPSFKSSMISGQMLRVLSPGKPLHTLRWRCPFGPDHTFSRHARTCRHAAWL